MVAVAPLRGSPLGHDVVLLYMNDGAWQQTSSATRIAEAKKACEILKARPAYANQVNGYAIVDNQHYQEFQSIIEKENPDAVFTHWVIDNHPDHRGIANLTFESWKQLKHRFAWTQGGGTLSRVLKRVKDQAEVEHKPVKPSDVDGA